MTTRVKISESDYIDVFVSFDTFGNLYVSVNNDSYQVNINGKNDLCAEKELYENFEEFKKLSKIQICKQINNLKNKIHEELSDDIEYDATEYYPEKNEYIELGTIDSDELIDEDNTDKYGNYNCAFYFSSGSDDDDRVPVHIRDEISALYDTYYYKNDLIHTISSSKLDDIIYTLKIYDNGRISLRPTGDKERYYEITLSNNDIVFKKL